MTSPISAVTATQGTLPSATQGILPSATAGTVPSAAAVSAAPTSSNSLLDPQAFLKLLVAQLQYQDPTSPTDTSSFMNQTATLSQVQTMNSMSSTLTALAQAQQTQAATDLVGKQVSYVDGSGLPATGVVTSASFAATGATLQVGGVAVPLSGVTSVTATGPTAVTATGPTAVTATAPDTVDAQM